jgi:hypothetical protein
MPFREQGHKLLTASQKAVLLRNSPVKKYVSFYRPGRYNEMQVSAHEVGGPM